MWRENHRIGSQVGPKSPSSDYPRRKRWTQMCRCTTRAIGAPSRQLLTGAKYGHPFLLSPYFLSYFFCTRQIINSRTTWQRFPTRFPISFSSSYRYTVHVRRRKNSYPLVISWGLLFVLYVRDCYPRNSKIYLSWFQGCALIGLGSFLFHATLLYEAQLADELPMIYVASFQLAILLESEPGFGLQSIYSKTLVAATVVFDIVFTAS
jgi:Ceramidase